MKEQLLQQANATSPGTFKERVIGAAIAAGHLSETHVLAAFVDVEGVARTIEALTSAFPANFRHAFAAKANTMSDALRLVRACGMGCEVASPGELEQALRVGFDPADIVYDEPAKTRAVIERSLQLGVTLNIDNFQEYERVVELMNETGSSSRVGFRINPQVGSGSIDAMSTATNSSKFGVALEDAGNRERIVDCYAGNRWMTSIHTHIGSQGCPLELMIQGIAKVVALAEEINGAVGSQQVTTIDIGGGLPVNFDGDEFKPTFAEYASLLAAEVPELFSGKYTVKTEFGRSIFAKNGFIAARVEYTKESGGRRIAVSHAGAQIAARTVFMPSHWAIRLSVATPTGAFRVGEEVSQDVAGPCCFAGDIIGHERKLPLIEQGDYIVLHDTGAYYPSNPFFYNSLPAPAVYGAAVNDLGTVEFDSWRDQQTTSDVLAILG